MRPDSARGVLKRFAKITAPTTKSARTPTVVLDKENVAPEEEDEVGLKKPRLTLELEDENSLVSDVEESGLPEGYEEEEDSELVPAPTPSVLPDDYDEVNGRGEKSVTFKSIDFARQPGGGSEKIDRRKSRVSFAQLHSEADEPDDEDDDPTVLTERGRRATSEDMTGRLSRYSFGSIRMSDFGDELEVRRENNPKFQQKLEDSRHSLPGRQEDLLEGETELLDRLRSSVRQSPSMVEDDGPIFGGGDDNDDFELPMPEDHGVEAARRKADINLQPEAASSANEADGPEVATTPEPHRELSPEVSRHLTTLETAASTTISRSRSKKRLKQTRHGTTVPSLPSSLIKRVAIDTQVRNGRRKPKLGKDHMKALDQATEWFFEQIGEDLGAYAEHGRRKVKITVDDVMMLMQRTRVLKEEGELGRLAEEMLPEEVAAELDLDEDA